MPPHLPIAPSLFVLAAQALALGGACPLLGIHFSHFPVNPDLGVDLSSPSVLPVYPVSHLQCSRCESRASQHVLGSLSLLPFLSVSSLPYIRPGALLFPVWLHLHELKQELFFPNSGGLEATILMHILGEHSLTEYNIKAWLGVAAPTCNPCVPSTWEPEARWLQS